MRSEIDCAEVVSTTFPHRHWGLAQFIKDFSRYSVGTSIAVTRINHADLNAEVTARAPGLAARGSVTVLMEFVERQVTLTLPVVAMPHTPAPRSTTYAVRAM